MWGCHTPTTWNGPSCWQTNHGISYGIFLHGKRYRQQAIRALHPRGLVVICPVVAYCILHRRGARQGSRVLDKIFRLYEMARDGPSNRLSNELISGLTNEAHENIILSPPTVHGQMEASIGFAETCSELAKR